MHARLLQKQIERIDQRLAELNCGGQLERKTALRHVIDRVLQLSNPHTKALGEIDPVTTKSAAQTLRARAAALRVGSAPAAAVTRAAVAPELHGAVKLIAVKAPPASAVHGALAYARTLGDPKKKGSVMLGNAAGEALYLRTLNALRESDRYNRVKRTADGERQEVIRRLGYLPGGGPVKLNATGAVKLACRVQKFMNGSQRVVHGFASTDDIDRVGDIVVPSGMQAKTPLPLLFAHDHKLPIGSVQSAQIKAGGIWIEATLATGVKQADEVAALIDAQALDSFSIGFRGLKTEPLATGGLRFTSWELLEVSVVSVPANPNAKIRRSV